MLDRLPDILTSLNIYIIVGILLLLSFFYFIPTLMAVWVRKKQTLAIFLLNLLLGWTFLGWLAALIWSAIKEKTDGVQE